MATVKKIKKAQFGAPIRRGGYRGGCAATTAGADRAERREGRQAEREYNQQMRQNRRDERKEARAERKAAKAAPAKYGKAVKKAQTGKMVPSEMKPGKMISKSAQAKRTDSMAKSLDKASVLGSKFKKVVKKKSGGPVKKACWGSKMK
jgi:hypothetical protein